MSQRSLVAAKGMCNEIDCLLNIFFLGQYKAALLHCRESSRDIL